MDYAAIAAAVFNIGSSILNYQNSVTQMQGQAYSYGTSEKVLKEQKSLAQQLRPYQKAALRREGESLSDSYNTNKELLGFQKEVVEVQRLKQRTQEALSSGDAKLAQAEATKAARIESSQVRLAGAQGGMSAFTRATAQMSTNKLSTIEQKIQALGQEKLLNAEEYGAAIGTIDAKSGNLTRQYGRDSATLKDKQTSAGLQYRSQQKEFDLRVRDAQKQQQLIDEMLARGKAATSTISKVTDNLGVNKVAKSIGLW